MGDHALDVCAVSNALHDATYKSATGATSLVCNLAIEQSKQGEMPNITGDVKTTGLAIYYAYYKYVKKKTNVKNENTGGESEMPTKKVKPKKEESALKRAQLILTESLKKGNHSAPNSTRDIRFTLQDIA